MTSHDYQANVVWVLADGEKFTDNRFPRAHVWRFDGGVEVPASSSPLVVPPPRSAIEAVDPEEAFIASLSSCHMLFFLFHAARRGLVVERYDDQAMGTLGKNGAGCTAMLRVALRPQVTWGSGGMPDAEILNALHEAAHRDCYIANSVTTEVVVEPR